MLHERLLIVEDEPVVALDLQQTLQEMGHEVTGIASDLPGAVHSVEVETPSMILMDIHIDGKHDGVETAHEIYQRYHIPIIYLTAYADDQTIQRAAETKPFGYLLKPFEVKELAAVIQVARNRHDTEVALIRSETRLAVAVEAAELATWEWESQLDLVHGDQRFQAIWGSSFSQFETGLSALLARVHPDEQELVQQSFSQEGFFSSTFRARRDNGDYAWLEMHGKLQITPAGHRQVIGAMRDITSRKKMEERLRQASVVFSTTAEGIMILDAEHQIISVNPAFTALTGFSLEDVSGKKPDDFLLLRRGEDFDYNIIASSEKGYGTGEIACQTKQGKIFPALQHICSVRDDMQSSCQFVHIISDITIIREAEKQLAHLAYHDPLTGLGNRFLLEQQLNNEIARCALNKRKVAVLFLDLDSFKSINDSLGHHVGDRVIQEVAYRISKHIRQHDVAIRLGGDEFIIVNSELRSLTEATRIAQKLNQALIKNPIVINELSLMVTASIGIAMYPEDGTNATQLLSAADSAMYEAKRLGKSRACVYNTRMTDQVKKRLDTEQQLHFALERGEFELYYQPVISLVEQKLTGFEALIRWNNPTLGLVGPDKFIGIAEESGLIDKLGYWILDTGLAQIARFRNAGYADLFMAINVSPKQFNDDNFIEYVNELLDKHDLPGNALEIEVTESVIQDFKRSKEIVADFRTLGVNVAIDDFGTGYSSLALLKNLPITRMKIDRQFIAPLPGSASDQGMVSAIMLIAKSLQLDVTAEGIETYEQAMLLKACGCPAVQGYYFSRPQPADYFNQDWLREHTQHWSYSLLLN